MDFDSIWDQLLTRRDKSAIEKLEKIIVLENSFTSKEYYLSHMIKGSRYIYWGLDSESNRCIIKIVPMASFDELKIAYQNLMLLQGYADKLNLTEIQDIFEIYDNRWVLVIVCKYVEGLTLAEISEYRENLEIFREISVNVYLELVKIIEGTCELGVYLNVMPDCVLFVRKESQGEGVYSSNENTYEVRIAIWRQIRLQHKSEYEYLTSGRRNSPESEVWGAAICFFLLTSNKRLGSLRSLRDLEGKERTKELKVDDPAIKMIIYSSIMLQRPLAILKSRTIEIWRLFRSENWEGLEAMPINDIIPLITIFKFKANKPVIFALRKILSSKNHSENMKVLSQKKIFFEFFALAKQRIDFVKYPALGTSLLYFFKDKQMNQKFITTLISLGFFSLFTQNLIMNSKSEIICKVSMNFLECNTLTLVQILYDNGFIGNLVKKPQKTQIELDFLKSVISYCGNHSLKLIYYLFENQEISIMRTVQLIYEIPFAFKLAKKEALLPIFKSILLKKNKISIDMLTDILKLIILIISEIYILQYKLQYMHLKGQCTSSPTKGLLMFVKNPMLKKCQITNNTTGKTNDLTVCIICYEKFHQSSDTNFLLNQSAVFRCNEELTSNIPPESFNLKLPVYQPQMEFKDIDKLVTQVYTNIIICDIDRLLISIGKIGVKDEVSAYFEVKIHKAGVFENIFIGVHGTGVTYYGSSGKITRNGHLVGEGPRLGSFDVIGAGVYNNRAFFTYNGMLLRPMIQCLPQYELRAKIGFCGNGLLHVEAKFTDWIFLSESSQKLCNLNEIDDIIGVVMKKVIKIDKKKENKADDIAEKLIELLQMLNKTDILEKFKAAFYRKMN